MPDAANGGRRLLATVYPPCGAQRFKRAELLRAFDRHPEVELVPVRGLGGREPDIVVLDHFFGPYTPHEASAAARLSRRAVTVLHSGEACAMDLRALCDWSFGFGASDGRHMFAHLYSLLTDPGRAASLGLGPALRAAPKERFCHFMYSNRHAPERIAFARRLMRERPVDCLGPVLGNMPALARRECAGTARALAPYKFGVAFENHSRPGYVTEKIAQCFLAGNVPVYWGDPTAAWLFNPEAFINCHDFASLDEAAEHVLRVDSDPELYARYRAAPPLLPGSPLWRAGPAALDRRVAQIVDSAGRIERASGRRGHWLRLQRASVWHIWYASTRLKRRSTPRAIGAMIWWLRLGRARAIANQRGGLA